MPTTKESTTSVSRVRDDGNYDAVQDPITGNWTIHNVEIFGEVPPGAKKGDPKGKDREWLVLAVNRHRERFNENGYLAPVHVRHHGLGEQTFYAGKLKPTTVGRIQYQGKPHSAVFADIQDIPPNVYDLIRRGELAYRSVEIKRGATEFASLSLLPDEAPFFKYRMTLIRNENRAEGFERETEKREFRDLVPVVASRAFADDTEVFLFNFSGGMKMADEPKKTDEGPDKSQEGMDPMRGLMEAVQAMSAKLDAVLERMGNGGPDTSAEDMPPAEPEDKDKNSDSDDQTIKLSAEVAALKEKESARSKKEKADELYSDARQQLKGWHFGDEAEKKLREACDMGERAVRLWVDTFKENVPPDPDADVDDFGAGRPEDVPEVVAKYNDPDERSRAMKAYRDYEALPANIRGRFEVKEYIDLELSGIGV